MTGSILKVDRASTLIVGCGYLGQRVARQLVARGDRVFGTTRTPARAEVLTAMGIVPVLANVLEPGTLDGLPEADRALVCVGFDRTQGVPIQSVYVDGLRHVLGRLIDRVGSLVYASSTGVYGGGDGDWIDEDSPAEPNTESGQACLEGERLVCAYEGERALPSTILRFSGLYGPGRIMRRDALIRGEEIVGDPDKILNLIHIEDAATASVAALDQRRGEELVLISDDRPAPRFEFYSLAAECLGGPTPRFRKPEPGSPKAPREGSNKRIRNRWMHEVLGVSLRYPDIKTGVPASLLGDIDFKQP